MSIQYVKMIVGGRESLVPVDKAPLLARKEKLVAEALRLQNLNDPAGLKKVLGKIISLNRRIGPCVRSIPNG